MEELTTSASLDLRATRSARRPPDTSTDPAKDLERSRVSATGDVIATSGMIEQAASAFFLAPAHELAQLRKWRRKAALYGTLGHHPTSSLVVPPGMDEEPDGEPPCVIASECFTFPWPAFEPLKAARDYYRRCWLLIHVHGASFPLGDIVETYAEYAMFLRVGGSATGCLAVCADCLEIDGSSATVSVCSVLPRYVVLTCSRRSWSFWIGRWRCFPSCN
jgi:hypothetical protein